MHPNANDHPLGSSLGSECFGESRRVSEGVLDLSSNVARIGSLQQAPLPSPSSRAIPTQHTPNEVKTHQVNRTTHQTIVTHSRVSSKTANPQSGNMPSANDIVEHSSERSNVIKGLTIEQALTSSTSEVEERRRVPSDTVVSMQKEAKENVYTLSHSAASMLPTPTAQSIPSTHAVPHLQPSDDLMPPIEVISERCDLNVVSKTSEVYLICS